jgi:hypothetical protein
MYYGKAEAGVGIDYQDLTRQDVEDETTGTYLWRVLVVNTRPSAPNVESEILLGAEFDSFSHWCECFSVNGAGAKNFEALQVMGCRIALVPVKTVFRVQIMHG